MNVLIACEESQEVCKAFRERGHNAYSCDIQECSGGHPEWHIKGDCLPLLNGNCSFCTEGGISVQINGKWDLIIAHPPCTYLSNVATRSFSLRCTAPEKVVERWKNRACAAVFFMYFVLADCDKIAIENPVGFMSTAYRKADDIIDPYMFAESVDDVANYVKKRTCLWLKGLPKLIRNDIPEPKIKEMFGVYPSGKAGCWEDQQHGSKTRSKTFPGIARAMAEQWG